MVHPSQDVGLLHAEEESQGIWISGDGVAGETSSQWVVGRTDTNIVDSVKPVPEQPKSPPLQSFILVGARDLREPTLYVTAHTKSSSAGSMQLHQELQGFVWCPFSRFLKHQCVSCNYHAAYMCIIIHLQALEGFGTMKQLTPGTAGFSIQSDKGFYCEKMK